MDQPLEINDFSGGITDNFVDAPLNRYEEGDNFNIEQAGQLGKLKQRPGSEVLYNADITGSPTDTVANKKYFEDRFIVVAGSKIYAEDSANSQWDAEATASSVLLKAASNNLLPGISASDNVAIAEGHKHLLFTTDKWNKPVKLYKNGSSYYGRTAGLPKIASSGITVTPTGGALTYLYAFVHKYTYTTTDMTFLDRSAPSDYKTVVGGTFPHNISVIPVLSNGATTNYDTSNIKIEIYRTVGNGTILYYVGEVTNGTTTFEDKVSDSILITNEMLYTEDGSQPNDEPPLAKYVHVSDNIAFYANIKEGSVYYPNRLYHSIQGDLDSVPSTFFVQIPESILGVSSFRSIPLVFCGRSLYRIEGSVDVFGRGAYFAIRVAEIAGCKSHNAIVQTLVGVFWAGDDGFYWTDGYQVKKSSIDLETSYKAKVNVAYSAKYDELNQRVYFAVQGVDSVHRLFVAHLKFGLSAYTTWSNGINFKPTALEVVGGNLYRSTYAFIFKHFETKRTDPEVDTGVAASTWTTVHVPYSFKSFSTSFGNNFTRKFCTRIVTTCKALSALSLQLISDTDDGKIISDLKPIRSRGYLSWGEDDVYWGDDSLVWNFSGLIQEQRRFPAGALRCSYKQIQMRNAEVNIANSDFLGAATLNNIAKTVVISGKWPIDPVGWYIYFSSDNYTEGYLITSRTSDTQIVIDDSGATMPSGAGIDFLIKGYPKNEVFYLIGFSLHWQPLGRTQNSYTASEAGGM